MQLLLLSASVSAKQNLERLSVTTRALTLYSIKVICETTGRENNALFLRVLLDVDACPSLRIALDCRSIGINSYVVLIFVLIDSGDSTGVVSVYQCTSRVSALDEFDFAENGPGEGFLETVLLSPKMLCHVFGVFSPIAFLCSLLLRFGNSDTAWVVFG